MKSIVLCDENDKILQKYEEIIDRIAKKENLLVKINRLTVERDIVTCVTDPKNGVDVVYLDLGMNSGAGLDIALRIRQMGYQGELVLLTSNADMDLKVFEVSPIACLLKSQTSVQKFERVFLKAYAKISKKVSEIFLCRSGTDLYNINLTTVKYFDVKNRIATVHYENGKTITFYCSMERFEALFKNHDFLRTQRSYMVNLRHVKAMDKHNITMVTGEIIPIGTTYSPQVQSVLATGMQGMVV